MMTRLNWLAVLLQTALFGAANAADKAPDECGVASIYSSISEETASGEDTRADDFTAAHRSLPFGTLIHVNNQDNGRSAVVRILAMGAMAVRLYADSLLEFCCRIGGDVAGTT